MSVQRYIILTFLAIRQNWLLTYRPQEARLLLSESGVMLASAQPSVSRLARQGKSEESFLLKSVLGSAFGLKI